METEISRRSFLKLSGAAAASLAIVQLGFDDFTVRAASLDLKTKNIKPTPTICPYCAVGCGILVYATENDVVYTEGDPDHPINEGTLCSKGTTIRQIYTSEKRHLKPKYRAPGADKWEEKDWAWMYEEIAKRVKDTRDRTFKATEKDAAGNEIICNKTEAIASFGGAALDNEETYLISKFLRGGLGMTSIEHQARLCHSSTVPGLSPSFGRGAMTNHWNDLQHADVFLVMGANPAENHPISFKWILKAKEKGGKLISVDPRFSRTSVLSDLYAPLRSGTDIAFLGGMIKYILEEKKFFDEYVRNYTNATFIVGDGYDFKDGIFSGYTEEKRSYDKTKWAFKTVPALDPVTQQPILDPVTKLPVTKTATDPTLQDPRCVFQLMKNHYSRYDLETVSKTTGTPVEQLKQVYELYSSTGTKDKAGTIMYAMGITQHSVGAQNIRAFAMVQLLLGNIGIAGGGVNALRGESNVQGSTDFGLLYGNTTGYMETPTVTLGDSTWDGFMSRITPKTGFFSNKSRFYVALQKAYYGNNARLDNEWGYNYLPKLTNGKDYSHMRLMEAIASGSVEGAFVWGANPVVGGPNSVNECAALGKLKWAVIADLWEHETSVFWSKEAGSNPKEIQTEVFFLPACGSFEKEGTISNSGRWMQYRWEAIHPKGESKSDLEMVHNIALKVKALYKNSTNPHDAAINALTWDFGGEGHPDIDKVAREINGYDLTTGKLLEKFAVMTTPEAVLGNYSAGNWIYTGFYTEKDGNKSKKRDNTDKGIGNFLNWSYAWPANRRILYNRASCDLDGNPYNKDKVVIKWGKDANGVGAWVGNDVPDFTANKAPDTADGSGRKPFIMSPSLVGNLYAALNEGPLPEHYEPWESPTKNNFSSIQLNPASKLPAKGFDQKGEADKFPIVATTYRVSEHWQTGAMTRNLEWLAEINGHMFVELSEELAKEKGIKHKEKVIVSSARGEIEVYAMVTKRWKPRLINGKEVHQLGMPWSFGFKGYAKGAIANTLTHHVGDANSTIPEYKAFLCDIRRAK